MVMRKSVVSVLIIELFICTVFASPAGAGQAHSDRQVLVDSQSFKYENVLMDITLQVPVIHSLEDSNMEEWLNSILLASVAGFVGPVCQAATEYALEVGFEKLDSVPFLPFEVYVTYDVKRNDGKLVSILLDKYGFTGGAHGFSDWEAFNLDTETGKVLKLEDIFRSEAEWQELIRTKINAQMAEDTESYYFPPGYLDSDWVPDSQKFYVTDTDLVIFFDLYEIAPYASGHPTFSIPLESIRDMLKPMWQNSLLDD